MDHVKTGGTLLNMKFAPSLLAGEEGIARLAQLVRTYFRSDGHHVQFNVVSRETLEAAKADPEEHRDLIVRVAGYSDYFCDLSRRPAGRDHRPDRAAGAMTEETRPGPRALVTGATGFLGGHLAAALVSRGYRVRALSRRTSGLDDLERLGVEVVRGDLADVPSLVRAASGVGLVFHAAGRVSDWGPREAFLRRERRGDPERRRRLPARRA